MTTRLSILALLVLVFVAILGRGFDPVAPDVRSRIESSSAGARSPLAYAEKPAATEKKAARELAIAVKLLNAKRYDQGIERLQSLIAKYPAGKAAVKAKELLVDFGVGTEMRVRLLDRATFRKRLKLSDPEFLKQGEAVLTELRKYYRALPAFYSEHAVVMDIYDSQRRYRKATGLIQYAGHFEIESSDFRKRTMKGKVAWYLPPYANTLKDRTLAIRSLLYHELTHYLNAIHFARVMPYSLNEGIASYLTSRLQTEHYQYYRQTERQRIERNARNGTHLIQSFASFEKLLKNYRGFAKADETLSRWYGICYAMVDLFVAEGSSNSLASFLRTLHEICGKDLDPNPGAARKQPPRPRTDREVLEELTQKLLGVDLKTAHGRLVKHILKNYRQG